MSRCILLALAMASMATPAMAAHKYLPPLTGLVPSGYTMPESTAAWLPEQLKQKSLAIVVSGNLDVTLVDWKKIYGRAKPESAEETIGKAVDPALFVRRMIAALRPRFGAVSVVPDIATARRQRADYIAVIDYDMSYRTSMLKTFQVFHGGVTLLDGSVARVFTVEAENEVRSNNPSMMALDFGQVSIDDTTAAYAKTSDQVAAALDAKLR